MTRLFANRRALAVMVLSLAVLLILPSALAQETTAGLQGTVKDSTGAVVANATVEVTSPALIGVKKMQTDQAGRYRFSNLPPGEYTMTITAAGFKNYKQTGIPLEVGKLPTFDIALQVGAVAETVEVSGAAPLVDVTQSKVATNIPDTIIDNVPKGRSFQTLINFAPGARQEPLQDGYQIDGASASENAYLVEGMDTTNIQTGAVGTNVPMEFVQEVQIKSSGFEAEYGGALGGVVNVVQKRGSNDWHGSVVTYLRSSSLDAGPRSYLRNDPDTTLNTVTRTPQTAQYYVPKADRWKTVDPGFELGGPVLKDKVWVFGSYVPDFYSLQRAVQFRDAARNPTEIRNFFRHETTHYGMGRVDFLATEKIRLFGSWQYVQDGARGTTLPSQDSVNGLYNSSSTTDPGIYTRETGFIQHNSTYVFGGDVTVTPKFIVTGRYGYWYTNYSDRGLPTGTRYQFQYPNTGLVGLNGTAVPSQYQFSGGWQNIGSNAMTVYDKYTRKGLSTDASYFARFAGVHNLKFGYGFNNLANDVKNSYNTGRVLLYWNDTADSTVVLDSGIANCAAINAANGGNGCRGNYGWYMVREYGTFGNVSSRNHSLYFQDAWTLGKGVSINAGLRFDKERLPSYKPGDPEIKFGFGDKMAPRIGGAWDVKNNGKLKLYGSFGLFYDIMKYELPRGSFGGDYWHDCLYTLDTPNFWSIVPTAGGNGHTCPGATAYPGTFIEEPDWRVASNDPSDNRIAPGLKPMRQREYVFGADYAIKSNLGFESRYSRKRLDRTIEDVGTLEANGENYWIANPGEGVVKNVLAGGCPGCQASPKAIRNYDALEFRLTKRASAKWWGSLSYTWSRLYGNYSGLTSTDESGRHSPNVNRFFDQPHAVFTPAGKIDEGYLWTDRPHTVKLYGFYNLKWAGMTTTLGLGQMLYSGSALGSRMNVISSLWQHVEGIGNWVDVTRDPVTGDLVKGAVHKNFRTPWYQQTDLHVAHSFKVSKTNEAMRATIEMNVINALNQRNILRYAWDILASGHAEPRIACGTNGDGTTKYCNDWLAATTTGFDYIAVANHPQDGSKPRVLNGQYGKPNLFQDGRALRLKFVFTF